MLGALRSGRSHPTPEEALDALQQGFCMYAPTGSACSGPPASVGLRDEDDPNSILVCKAHFGRMRRLKGSALDGLERFLVSAFADKRRQQRELEEPPPKPDGSRLVVR